jgi:phage regulator Rha-like protein
VRRWNEKEEKLLKEMFIRENLKRALREYDEAPESTQREVDAAIAESLTKAGRGAEGG